MEEDIKIIETYIKEREYKLKTRQEILFKQAIENLIKGYKELEEMLKHRIKYTNELEKDLFENASNYVIPKSKVREKIEYYKNKGIKDDYNKCFYDIYANTLQELLEERN